MTPINRNKWRERNHDKELMKILLAGLLSFLFFVVMVIGFFAWALWPVLAQAQVQLRPQSLLMPPAKPIFEDPVKLLVLTMPVRCVRKGALRDKLDFPAREWIRQWGDGHSPAKAEPVCVNAYLSPWRRQP